MPNVKRSRTSKLLLPEFLVEYFDILKAETHDAQLHIYFEEKSIIPAEFKEKLLESKGFLPEIIVESKTLECS
ncbi:ISAon1 family transposase N-terminal region protein [Chryseobacterium cucumeris]